MTQNMSKNSPERPIEHLNQKILVIYVVHCLKGPDSEQLLQEEQCKCAVTNTDGNS